MNFKKNKPFYRAHYQMELAIKVTGRNQKAIRMMMKRKGLSLAKVIAYYIKND